MTVIQRLAALIELVNDAKYILESCEYSCPEEIKAWLEQYDNILVNTGLPEEAN